MDKMQDWEVNDVLDNLPYTDRNTWEQCKVMSLTTAQCHSTKKIDPEKFMEFNWGADEYEEHNYEITDTQIEELTKLAKSFEK